VFDEDGAKGFAKKYKTGVINGPFVEDGFWTVEVERRFRSAEEKIIDSLGDPLRVLEAKGIPSHVAKAVSRGFGVTSDLRKIDLLVRRNNGFGVFLRDYFEKESVI